MNYLNSMFLFLIIIFLLDYVLLHHREGTSTKSDARFLIGCMKNRDECRNGMER
jgi:hypothetical protein